ncbi:MAG: PIN domain-containing protein [Bacteroidales bacterium]|nr:PIN domain-containing protein [Bacteroidales bacterium]
MKVFLDTNVLLDYGQMRDGFMYADAIFQLGSVGYIEICASYLSYANMNYILRRLPQDERYELLNILYDDVNVISCDTLQLKYALTHQVKDFEDMLQYRCAQSAGCDILVTNDIDDYKEFCDMPFMTPLEFLNLFFKDNEL